MFTIQDVHKELMDSINTAIENAQKQLDQIDPSGEQYNLNVVVDATIVVPASPTDPSNTKPILTGVSLVALRENIARTAAMLAETASQWPATVPCPEGFIGMDFFCCSHTVTEEESSPRFSVN